MLKLVAFREKQPSDADILNRLFNQPQWDDYNFFSATGEMSISPVANGSSFDLIRGACEDIGIERPVLPTDKDISKLDGLRYIHARFYEKLSDLQGYELRFFVFVDLVDNQVYSQWIAVLPCIIDSHGGFLNIPEGEMIYSANADPNLIASDVQTFLWGNEKDIVGDVRHFQGLLAEKNTDDLFEQSSLVVVGVVTGISEGFQVRSPSGSTANFTDYYISVSDAIRGATDEEIITVRVQGGTAGGYTEIYEPNVIFEAGDEYLLFLYKPGRGGAFNTEGDYYYILGLSQGVFSSNDSSQFVSQSGAILEQETLVSRAMEKPVDEEYFRNEFINNQESNLENGFITLEEYNEMMENLDIYATIIE
ncbi:MAG: hypothetical protein LBK75_00555 [Oscillospiraceae bacterium]|nr:hypothetical protein [Oscillospiraceae bacterium]